MPLPTLNDWPPGQTWPSGAHLQQAVDALRYLDQAETTTERVVRQQIVEIWPGIITNAGPAGEPDWKNERYWIKRTFVGSGYSIASIDLSPDIRPDGSGASGKTQPYIFTGSNAAEHVPGLPGHGSHLLRTDESQAVIAIGVLDRGNDQPRVRYLFSLQPPPIDVKVLAAGAGAGWYTGAIWLPFMTSDSTDFDPASDLTEDDTGEMGVPCLIYNRREIGTSGHMLDVTGTYQPLVFPATYKWTQSDGTPVFAVDAAQDQACGT